MRIVHTSQGVFFENNDDLVPLAQSEAVQIFGFLDENPGMVETLQNEIITKLQENITEFIRQIAEFDEVTVEPVMSYISSLMNYRSVCQVAYKQYTDAVQVARNSE